MKDETNLTPQEQRLCDLLFEICGDEEDLDFVNDIMEIADDYDIFDEISEFIEATKGCTKDDVFRFFDRTIPIELVDD